MATLAHLGALSLLSNSVLDNHNVVFTAPQLNTSGTLTLTKGSIGNEVEIIKSNCVNHILDKIADITLEPKVLASYGGCRIVIDAESFDCKRVLKIKWQKKQPEEEGGKWVDSCYFSMNAGVRLYCDSNQFNLLQALLITHQYSE